MKKKFFFIIGFILLFGCTNDKNKKDFLGRWNDFTEGVTPNDIIFRNDSIIVHSGCDKSLGTWKVDRSKIYIDYNFKEEYKQFKLKQFDTLNYRFNKTKDSLFIINSMENYDHLLIKVTNNWDHFSKKIGFKINLPETNKKLVFRDSIDYSPNLYLKKKSDSLIFSVGSKTNHKYTKDLKRSILMNLNFNNDTKYINIVADKNVIKAEIDSVKNIISEIGIPKLKYFRVYQNQKANYGFENIELCDIEKKWNWWGVYED